MPVDPQIRAAVALTLARLDEVEVTVEKLVAGGEGLARVDGAPLFVPLAAPGDRLLVRVVERHPDFGRAQIVRILEPGPGRREAPCPHFERCGGCDLQHLDDERQSLLKAQAAIETLRRLGRVERLPEARLVRGRAWGYRLRAQVRTELVNERVLVGYYERGSHTLVPIRVCPILLPELEAAVTGLPAVLGAEAPRRVDVAVGDDGLVTAAPPIEALERGSIARRVGRFTYELDARVFFQTHAGLLGDLQREVCGRARGELAVDLYSGVGLFTLPLASRYRKVIAVESDRVAARFAVRNARANSCHNVEVVSLSAETWARSMPSGIDRMVVDPPRTGLPRSLRRALVEARVPRLTYVSCHPATLARDMRDLGEGYSILGLTLLDLFPQTGHIETVVELEAKPKEATPPPAVPERSERATGRPARPGGARSTTSDRGRPRSTDRPRWERRDRPRPESTDRPPPRRERPRDEPSGRPPSTPRDRGRPESRERPRWEPRERPGSAPRDRTRPGPTDRPPSPPRDRGRDRSREDSTDRRRPPTSPRTPRGQPGPGRPRPAGGSRPDDGNRRPPRDRPRPPRTKR